MVTAGSPSVHVRTARVGRGTAREKLRRAEVAVDYIGAVLRRDVTNALRYGRNAPRWGQRIWVDPRRVRTAVFGHGAEQSARVLGGDWDVERLFEVDALPKVQLSRLHWEQGTPWEETGLIRWLLDTIAERGQYDGCRTEAELIERYRSVDDLYRRVQDERRLRARSEVAAGRGFREVGGVRIHIGRSGEPIFGGAGHHRLAMARTLDLEVMPAVIGIVHADSIGTWKRRYGAPPTADRRATMRE